MGRIKKNHSGWRTHGIWMKYQTPKVNEQPVKPKSKKDTNKWCRGKVGTEHIWHRFEEPKWDWVEDTYTSTSKSVAIKCIECGKEKYAKTAKAANYPLHIFVDQKYCGYDPVQVRVNGEYKPLTIYEYKRGRFFCRSCGFCH